MNNNLIYTRIIVIAHGRSELLFAEHIKSNLHLPIEIYSDKNGRKSIQIDGLIKILTNTKFKNKTIFKKNYAVEEKDKKIKVLIMPIMDLDDTTDEQIEKYKSGEMFNRLWLKDNIVPIWNDKSFDDVLYNLGIIDKLPNNKNKGFIYGQIFPTNIGESDCEQVTKLYEKFQSTEKSNLKVFLKECLNLLN